MQKLKERKPKRRAKRGKKEEQKRQKTRAKSKEGNQRSKKVRSEYKRQGSRDTEEGRKKRLVTSEKILNFLFNRGTKEPLFSRVFFEAGLNALKNLHGESIRLVTLDEKLVELQPLLLC